MLKVSHKLDGIAISKIRKMNALAKPSTINLGIGQLPNDVPQEVCDAGINGFITGKTRYTANQGSLELRESIAKSFTNSSTKTISADEIIITNGAEGAIWNILFTYLDEDDEVLIPEIGFSIYDTITKMQKATPITYKMGSDFSFDLLDIESKISNKTKFIIVNNPGNPTGKVYSKSEIEALTILTDKFSNLYIISDEIYSNLFFNTVAPTSPYNFSSKVIIVDGISKRGAATGLRIGWTIASKAITDPMIISNQYITTCASSISQEAALPILNDKCLDFENKIRDNLKENATYVYNELKKVAKISVEKPKGAFYIFPDISKFGKSEEVALKILKECDVLTIPGIAFGNRGDNHIRISFACNKDLLKDGISRIINLLNSL